MPRMNYREQDKLAMIGMETQPQTKRYILASDFDQTLSFNDSGYVLSEIAGNSGSGIRAQDHRHGQAQPGAAGRRTGLSVAARSGISRKVRREHLYEAGKSVRLKPNIDALYSFLVE